MSERSVWRMRSWISTPWFMQSFMVLIITGTADCGTALRAIRRWSEPRDMATTFAFFVAHPMKTGRSKSSDCCPSRTV